jgi:RNA polymerase sporulation-specific sigma factor
MEINEEYINDYVKMAQQGDKEIHNALIRKYKTLVRAVIKKRMYDYSMGAKGIEQADLIQVGLMGLNKAILDYDFRKNVKFTTWATENIKSAVARYTRDVNLGMYLSRGAKELYKDYKHKKNELSYQLGREPTVEEVAEELNCECEKLQSVLKAYNMTSLESDPKHLTKILEKTFNQDECIFTKILIEKAISTLDDISKYIIIQRYFNDKSQAEIAKKIGKSQMYVSRKESDSKRKMKDYLISIGYEGVEDEN